jgi:hypothetical protein
MTISFDPNNASADGWLQQSDLDFPFYDQLVDYGNNFNPYDTLDAWEPTSFTNFEPDVYDSPPTVLPDNDDYFTLNNRHAILPTLDGKPAQPSTFSQHSPTDSTSYPAETPKCKRGRPRTTSRKGSSISATSSSTSKTNSPISKSTRTPHNQVERKYREGINSEMERLRRAIPVTARLENGSSPSAISAIGSPKASKAMVLVCAIEYIHKVERQRDLLLRENRELRR